MGTCEQSPPSSQTHSQVQPAKPRSHRQAELRPGRVLMLAGGTDQANGSSSVPLLPMCFPVRVELWVSARKWLISRSRRADSNR